MVAAAFQLKQKGMFGILDEGCFSGLAKDAISRMKVGVTSFFVSTAGKLTILSVRYPS